MCGFNLCLSSSRTFAESVLEFARKLLLVTHTSRSFNLSALRLVTPVDYSAARRVKERGCVCVGGGGGEGRYSYKPFFGRTFG
jgi:hypothetical protein